VLETIAPFGQRRDDLRFAGLAQVLVAALGGTKADGTRFTASDFLARLDEGAPALAPARAQTVAEMEARIATWVGGHNARWRERGGGR
jgi:hypothetical protein